MTSSPYRSGASGMTATTRNGTGSPSIQTGRVPPRPMPASVTHVAVTATARPWKSSRVPRVAARPRAADAVAGSMISTWSRPPGRPSSSRWSMACRRTSATATAWSDAIDAAAAGLPASTTSGACSRARSCAVVQSAVKLRDSSSDPAMAEMATTGAATAAVVRAAARTSSRAIRAVTSRPTNGLASRAASRGMTAGPMLIRPITTTSGSRMEATSANSGGRSAERTTAAARPPKHTSRRRTATMLGRVRSIAASRRAALGVIRAARREDRQTPRSATTAPVGTATAQAIHGLGACRSSVGNPDGPHQPENSRGQCCAKQTARRGGRGRDDDGLAQQEPAHLPWRRADQAQQAELTPAASHDEAERTADHEEGHERRDRRHHPEHRGQVVELGALIGGDAGPAAGGVDASDERHGRRRSGRRRTAMRRRRPGSHATSWCTVCLASVSIVGARIIAPGRSSSRRSGRRRRARGDRRSARRRGTTPRRRTRRPADRGSP